MEEKEPKPRKTKKIKRRTVKVNLTDKMQSSATPSNIFIKKNFRRKPVY